jgi:hypothetical protein
LGLGGVRYCVTALRFCGQRQAPNVKRQTVLPEARIERLRQLTQGDKTD